MTSACWIACSPSAVTSPGSPGPAPASHTHPLSNLGKFNARASWTRSGTGMALVAKIHNLLRYWDYITEYDWETSCWCIHGQESRLLQCCGGPATHAPAHPVRRHVRNSPVRSETQQSRVRKRPADHGERLSGV